MRKLCVALAGLILCAGAVAPTRAQVAVAEPLAPQIHFADPSAHVFEGKVFVYGSHDVEGPPADDQPGKGFVMRDYPILSMDRIGGPVTLHPPALKLEDVAWADRQLWAPDAAHKDGRYYFYFPAKDRDGIFRIGVAVGDRPQGPFKPQPAPIKGAYSIDPAVFTDEDGESYLYFGGIHGGQLQRWVSGEFDRAGSSTDLGQPDRPALTPKMARLSNDMLSLAEPPRDIVILDEAGKPLLGGDLDRRFFEGAWVHKKGGLYHLSYSTGETHFIVYATSRSPYGPFTYRGRVLEPVKGWTTHGSIVEVDGRWRLFHHDADRTGRTNMRDAKVVDLEHGPNGEILTVRTAVPHAGK